MEQGKDMKRIQITPNFFLDEFIDPSIYAARGERSVALMDHRMIMFAQWLREAAGRPLTINNWASGGQFRESGLRRSDTRTGAKWSQHKYGRAIDIKCQGLTPRELFAIVKANEAYLIQHQLCTTIENLEYTVSWLHCDCRFTGLDRLLIVDP